IERIKRFIKRLDEKLEEEVSNARLTGKGALIYYLYIEFIKWLRKERRSFGRRSITFEEKLHIFRNLITPYLFGELRYYIAENIKEKEQKIGVIFGRIRTLEIRKERVTAFVGSRDQKIDLRAKRVLEEIESQINKNREKIRNLLNELEEKGISITSEGFVFDEEKLWQELFGYLDANLYRDLLVGILLRRGRNIPKKASEYLREENLVKEINAITKKISAYLKGDLAKREEAERILERLYPTQEVRKAVYWRLFWTGLFKPAAVALGVVTGFAFLAGLFTDRAEAAVVPSQIGPFVKDIGFNGSINWELIPGAPEPSGYNLYVEGIRLDGTERAEFNKTFYIPDGKVRSASINGLPAGIYRAWLAEIYNQNKRTTSTLSAKVSFVNPPAPVSTSNDIGIINHNSSERNLPFKVGFTVSPGINISDRRALEWNEGYMNLLVRQIKEVREKSGLDNIVISTYYPPVAGTDLREARIWLDRIYQAGGRFLIHILNYDDRYRPSFDVNFWNASGRPKDTFKALISGLKDHPAVLGWIVFNEYNHLAKEHPDWFGANNSRQAIENILGATQYVVSEIKKIDSGHPIYTVWADLPTKEQVSKVPSVDGWGINYYDIKRIINGEFFRKAQEIFGNKVFFIHETGVDSFDSATGRQNQELQAQEAVRIFEAALKYAPSNFKYLSFMSANDEPWKPQVEGCCIARSDGVADQFNGRYWGFFTQKGEPKRVVDLLFGKIKEMLGKKTIDRVAQVVRSTQPSEREERTTQRASRPEDTQRAAVEQKKEIVTTGLAGERKGIREELDRFQTEINKAKEELRKRSQMQNKGIKNTDEEIKRINESLDKILEEIERVKASLERSEPEEAKRYLEDMRLKATFDLIAGYVNLYNSNPENALKIRIEEIKKNSKGKNEIRIGIGYNWQNPLGSVLSEEFLPNIYLNILVPSDYYTASEALNLIKGLSAGRLRIAGYLGLGRNILFDLPNYIKGRPHQDESGLLVVPEGVRLKNPFVSKSTFYPQDIYKDGRWQKQGPVKYYDSPLLRLPDQVLPETFGRIPGIGKLFGDYRNTAVWEKTKYPAIVIFGNIEQEFYQKGLRNQDKNKLYLIRREGQDAALYEVDLKASSVKTWLRVPRFTPESKEYCKDFGLWQEDGEVYIIPSLWILEQIRLHHQVYSGKAIAALVNPLSGEILDDIRDPNTGKIQPGLITRLQDMPVTTKVKISYTRNGMVVNPNEETEVDIWTGIQLGTWLNGEPVYPVLIYSVDSAKLNYWLWRKIPVSERVDFVGDFIDLEGNITPIFKNNLHRLKQVKLDSLKEVELSDNYRITLPKGMPVYSLNGRLGIFVEKPERIPLARLSFNRGVFYLYDEKEIHSLLSAEKNKTTYAVFSDGLYALLEYGANLEDYRLYPDIWAVSISKEGIRKYSYPPLGVKPEDLNQILRQEGLERIPASIQKLLKDTEDIIALLSSAGEEYVTTDFINKLKEAKDRLSASESNLREAQKRYEEDINRQFEERTNSLLLLARGYFSALRAISEQQAKDNAELYLKTILSQMYPDDIEYNQALYSIKDSKDPVSTFKQYFNDYLKRQKEYALNLIQQESRNIEWLNYRIKILDKAIEDLTKPAEQVNDPEGFKDHIRPVEIELEAIQEALFHLSEQGKPKKDPEGFEQHTSSVRAELDKLQQAITHLSEQGKP
ncbi:MAG: hypothetical protein NC909_00495, partial [Candidatus Omnitrophica bacterium]|nr:hypothetical protein [Candidatus Omnitrophota bacterium]